MLISAALIVRDEAAFLDDCLRSVAALVDEIVVVDTGSTDGSPDIAAAHGATVDHFAWSGDFAAARNRSLDLAAGEWILYIDADEQLHCARPDEVRTQLAEDSAHQGFRVPFVPRVGWTPYREYRLWRHDPDIRFRGRIHEAIVMPLHEVAERHGRTIGVLDDLRFDHYGYEGDQSHKFERDEPLLRAAIVEMPERVFYYDHLARILEAQGRDEEAVAAWQQGIEVVRARDEEVFDDRLLWINLVVHLLARDRITEELAELIDEARARFPRIPALELAAATHDFALGHAAEAAGKVDWILGLTPEFLLDSNSSFDRRVLGEWPHNLLGLCRFELGDDAGAAEAFAAAEAAAPQEAVYRIRRQLAEARVAD